MTPNQRAAFLAELSIKATKYDVWARWLVDAMAACTCDSRVEQLGVVSQGLADDAEWIRERIEEMRR
jgi:hypothetical protein